MAEPSAAGSRPAAGRAVTLSRVFALWWPLAGSWLLMGVEMPLFAAVVARLPDERVQLAAFGSIVYPVSMLIEAPIIMLLAASTRLSGDLAGWRRLQRFTHVAGLTLTILHVAVAFTPLLDVLARDVIGVPDPVIEPARIGMQIMTPWTWAIAWRRFQQGVLIRFEQSRLVVLGTGVRIATMATVLIVGALSGVGDGVVVGTTGIAAGVVAEAVWAELAVRRTCLERLREGVAVPWTWREFGAFYVPLAATTLISMMLQPIGAAAMSRMPETLPSLATWPAVFGLVFMTRALGFALNEVVIALRAEPGAEAVLTIFARRLAVFVTAVLAALAFTPLGELWFGAVSGLTDELAGFAAAALGCAVLMPGYTVLQNLYQGGLVHERRTRGITEAVVLYSVVTCLLLLAFGWFTNIDGIRACLLSFTGAGILQTLWAWYRLHRG